MVVPGALRQACKIHFIVRNYMLIFCPNGPKVVEISRKSMMFRKKDVQKCGVYIYSKNTPAAATLTTADNNLKN